MLDTQRVLGCACQLVSVFFFPGNSWEYSIITGGYRGLFYHGYYPPGGIPIYHRSTTDIVRGAEDSDSEMDQLAKEN